jgi:type III pantothenate kinase
MNLIVDIGNTFIKLFVFDGNKLAQYSQVKTKEPLKINHLVDQYTDIKHAIISAVADVPDVFNLLGQYISGRLIFLDHQTPIPVRNLYKTPESLGKDRLAAIVGANNIYKHQNVLAIDAGTALTFDFINRKGEFAGGTISPGLSMRFQALNHFTKNLPLLEASDNYPFWGTTTHEAIVAGVQNGIIFETDAYIDDFKRKFDDLKVILTGGDTFFFAHKLKNTIFAEPNLVAIGLNRILQYNVESN